MAVFLGGLPLSSLRRAICSALREGLALVADMVRGRRAGDVISVVRARTAGRQQAYLGS